MSSKNNQLVREALTQGDLRAIHNAVNSSAMKALQEVGFRMAAFSSIPGKHASKPDELIANDWCLARHLRSCWKDPLTSARLVLDCQHQVATHGSETGFSNLSVRLNYVEIHFLGAPTLDEFKLAALEVIAALPYGVTLPAGASRDVQLLLPVDFPNTIAKRWAELNLTSEHGWQGALANLFAEKASRHFAV